MDSVEAEGFLKEAETLKTEWSGNPTVYIFLGSPRTLTAHLDVGKIHGGKLGKIRSILLPESLALQYIVGTPPSSSTSRPSANYFSNLDPTLLSELEKAPPPLG